VRHLVELHGGTVEAWSPGEGEGSTFAIRLPLLAAAPSQTSGERPLQTAAALPSREVLPSLAGLRILVVDDEPETVELLETVLDSCGAEVRTARSAAEAVAALDGWIPHVLISDIEMPGEDGYALVRRVRQLPRDRGGEVPAIALTAYARPEDRVRTLAAGFDLHLAKPVEPAVLAAAVARVAHSRAASASST
jgi:CheY-like chemotaxis protein